MREATTGEFFRLYRLEFEGRKAAEAKLAEMTRFEEAKEADLRVECAETARLRAALREICTEPHIWKAQGIALDALEDKKEGL